MKNAIFDQTLVLIPARMASTRLPGKPLADICGLPMIVQVAMRAKEADVGRIIVATDSEDIVAAVTAAGFDAVLTGAHHQSGSDRIFEALQMADPDGRVRTVINVQGDLPTIEPETIRAALRPLEEAAVDIATLTVEIADEEDSGQHRDGGDDEHHRIAGERDRVELGKGSADCRHEDARL